MNHQRADEDMAPPLWTKLLKKHRDIVQPGRPEKTLAIWSLSHEASAEQNRRFRVGMI